MGKNWLVVCRRVDEKGNIRGFPLEWMSILLGEIRENYTLIASGMTIRLHSPESRNRTTHVLLKFKSEELARKFAKNLKKKHKRFCVCRSDKDENNLEVI